MAAAEDIKKAMQLRGLFVELSLGQKLIIVHYDSQSAIHLTKDYIYRERTKHIDVRYHFIHDVISQGDILVKKIDTEDNSINMMTKFLPLTKFKECMNLIGLCST